MVAFLVAGAAATAGKDVTMFLTKEAVRLAVPGWQKESHVREAAAATLHPVRGSRGRFLVCPSASTHASSPRTPRPTHIGGATLLWQWIGDDGRRSSHDLGDALVAAR
jgi:hypothetical protein